MNNTNAHILLSPSAFPSHAQCQIITLPFIHEQDICTFLKPYQQTPAHTHTHTHEAAGHRGGPALIFNVGANQLVFFVPFQQNTNMHVSICFPSIPLPLTGAISPSTRPGRVYFKNDFISVLAQGEFAFGKKCSSFAFSQGASTV